MAKEKSLDIQVDVYIINENNKKNAKKNSRDEGVQKNLEKLHPRKNYHDSGIGSSRPTPPHVSTFLGLFTGRDCCSGKEAAH